MKNIAVIGLSSFGYYLCEALNAHGFNLMAIDIKEELVNQVKPFVRKAVIGDARDKKFLLQLGIADFDTVIISVGSKMDTSILITLYMKELKINEIIAKAINEDHAKILEKIGATRIIFPERDMGLRMAHTLASPNFLEFIPLTEGFSLIEVSPTREWLGKKLKEIDLRKKYKIQIAMIREIIPSRVVIPDGDFVFKDSDILYIIGDNESINHLQSDIS
ncbi:MAG: TrkA family potassium uptake protein [Ignavibacteriae bacterium]|nr:TrkA family potassium uptake protein [Ignavibacteriota bacterium]MCB0750621.1 TrkA family potassium uptake protein [Ignavibacteriota bacterium]